jgi:hypothetical protein
MTSVINGREVFDLETGAFVPQHKMLKILMGRAGLSRKQLHLATKGKLNVDRTASWLSDIFRGDKRHLAMRDIVSVIKAFKLNKKYEGHYIAEFFKAHCEEDLHPYIKTSQQSIKVQTLTKRIEEIKHHITTLTSALYYERHVIKKNEIETLEEKNIQLKQKVNDLEGNTLPKKPTPKPKPNDFENENDHHFAYQEWFDGEESDLEKTISKYEDNLDYNDPFDKLMSLNERSSVESHTAYYDAKGLLLDAMKELEELQKEDKGLFEYIRAFLPKDFKVVVTRFLQCEDELYRYYENPIDAWSWLIYRLEPRPRQYILSSLLRLWKEENIKSFELQVESYTTFFSVPVNERYKNRQHLFAGLGKKRFSHYLDKYSSLLRKKYPSLHRVMLPVPPVHVINHSRDEELAFHHFINHTTDNLANYIDCFEFYEGHFPSALYQPNNYSDFYSLFSCYFPLKIEGREQLSLKIIFDDYGEAEQQYDNVFDFLKQNVTHETTIKDKVDLAKTLARNLIESDNTKSWEKLQTRLENSASSSIGRVPRQDNDQSGLVGL